jgi:hypothetical protein
MWRDVVGYSGLYEVSRSGQVRSKKTVLRPTPYMRRGKVVTMKVDLYKAGKRKTVRVHRIVLAAWIGPCPDGYEGCHNDGDPANNAVSNLRYDTPENNDSDKLSHGTDNRKRVKRSDGAEYASLSEAARSMGIPYQGISAVCAGRRDRAGGYGWSYFKD